MLKRSQVTTVRSTRSLRTTIPTVTGTLSSISWNLDGIKSCIFRREHFNDRYRVGSDLSSKLAARQVMVMMMADMRILLRKRAMMSYEYQMVSAGGQI